MRSGVTATESGNTYEQLVRAWRLSEFIVDNITREAPPRWITFQRRDLRPWDDIVESSPSGLWAWQVKNVENPLSDAQLSELFQALQRERSIRRGVLAIGHVIVPKSGMDLMVLQGLAVASRMAEGELPRFAREKKELEGLSKVAELLGGVDLEQAFLMLQRFELRVLHGHADVREMTVRALHPFFAEPNQLARALLDFVVETGARGIEIHFDTLVNQVLTEFRRREVPWVPVPAGLPDDEVLLWQRDRRGVARTLWLSTKAPGLVAAELPGLYLGSRQVLWKWETSPRLVPFMIGLAEPYVDDGDEEGHVELKPVDAAHIRDTGSGATIPLDVISDFSSGNWVYFLDHTVEPLGAFDNILLVRAHAHADSGGAHGWRDAAFIALDLETGQRFDLWSKDEAHAYGARLSADAVDAMSRRKLCSEDVGDPEITVLTPYYDHAYNLRARLQFSFDVAYADTDDSWSDYYASTTVESDTLPTLLQPVATAPAVLRAYWDEHPMDERCGWSRVPSAGPARERLEALVREGRGR